MPHNNVTEWSVGITTAPRRQPTLARTLQSLVRAGWQSPRLFVEPGTLIPDDYQNCPISTRDQTLGAFPNWYLALTELVLRSPRAEAYLLCQDDVIFSEGLRNFLEQRLWPATKVGVVSVYCPSHHAVNRPDGFHAENRGWNCWGALGYIFPNNSARNLLTDPLVLNHRDYGIAKGLRNIDSVVGCWCQRTGAPYFVHTPSLAQHIGETSTIWKIGSTSGRRKASRFKEHL